MDVVGEVVCPADLVFDQHIFDVEFHPTRNIIACGLIDGSVETRFYNQGDGNENTKAFDVESHAKACRKIVFSEDGTRMFTASSDESIKVFDVETGKKVDELEGAHDSPINTLLCVPGTSMVASGDDDGVVKLWSLKNGGGEKKTVGTFETHEDYISDLAFNFEKKCIVATSGDGSLSVISTRKMKVKSQSDNVEDELLSAAIMKNGSKIVVGTQSGVINIYDWDDSGDMSDRFLGHPQSVDTMCVISDELLATGSSDGYIRVVSILPNKLLGLVGHHSDFPLEKICISSGNQFMASCSHDKTVKFWDAQFLFDEDDDDDEEQEEENEEEPEPVSEGKDLSSNVTVTSSDEVDIEKSSDDDNEEEDEEDEEEVPDDEEEIVSGFKVKPKRMANDQQDRKQSKKKLKTENENSFFEDL